MEGPISNLKADLERVRHGNHVAVWYDVAAAIFAASAVLFCCVIVALEGVHGCTVGGKVNGEPKKLDFFLLSHKTRTKSEVVGIMKSAFWSQADLAEDARFGFS